MPRKVAIGLCGLSKSGKDYVSSMLCKPEYGGFRVYNLTNRVLSPIAMVRNLPPDRDSLRRLLTKLDNTANEMLFVQVSADRANRVTLPNMRMLSTLEFWKRRSGFRFWLVKVDASDETRYRRYRAMSRAIDPRVDSLEEFKQRIDYRDLEVNELGTILTHRRFDYVIHNDDESDIHGQLRSLARKVLTT